MALPHAVRMLYMTTSLSIDLSALCKRKYHMAYYTLEQELCDVAQR